MEGSESQILELLELGAFSTPATSPTNAEVPMKEGNLREASWQREASCSAASSLGREGVRGVAAASGVDGGLDCDFFFCFELEGIFSTFPLCLFCSF